MVSYGLGHGRRVRTHLWPVRWPELSSGAGVAGLLPHWLEHKAKEAKGRSPTSEIQLAPQPRTLSLVCQFTKRHMS